MLQEGAAGLVARLLPEVTADDWYQALLAAQDYLLSLGITGWQDAIVGRYNGDADPARRLPARRAGGHAGGQRGRRAVVGTATAGWSSSRSSPSGAPQARPAGSARPA